MGANGAGERRHDTGERQRTLLRVAEHKADDEVAAEGGVVEMGHAGTSDGEEDVGARGEMACENGGAVERDDVTVDGGDGDDRTAQSVGECEFERDAQMGADTRKAAVGFLSDGEYHVAACATDDGITGASKFETSTNAEAGAYWDGACERLATKKTTVASHMTNELYATFASSEKFFERVVNGGFEIGWTRKTFRRSVRRCSKRPSTWKEMTRGCCYALYIGSVFHNSDTTCRAYAKTGAQRGRRIRAVECHQ